MLNYFVVMICACAFVDPTLLLLNYNTFHRLLATALGQF